MNKRVAGVNLNINIVTLASFLAYTLTIISLDTCDYFLA